MASSIPRRLTAAITIIVTVRKATLPRAEGLSPRASRRTARKYPALASARAARRRLEPPATEIAPCPASCCPLICGCVERAVIGGVELALGYRRRPKRTGGFREARSPLSRLPWLLTGHPRVFRNERFLRIVAAGSIWLRGGGEESHPMTSFSVVIPTLRRPEALSRAIESLLVCVPLPDEIIVVDGDPEGSARCVVEGLASSASALRLVYLASETGLTRQRNRGIDASSGDVVVFFDDDVVVSTAIFAHFADAYRDSQLVGVTGNVQFNRRRRFGGVNSRLRRWFTGRGKQGTFTRFGYPRYLVDRNLEQDVERQPGGLASARREAAAVTRFDELLTGYALAEDEDFSYRLSRLGRVRYVPSISIWHAHHGVRDQRAINKMLVVNRTYLFKKNFPQTAPGPNAVRFPSRHASCPSSREPGMGRCARSSRGIPRVWRHRRLLDDPRSFILGTRVETKRPSDSKTRASETTGED